MADKHYLTCPAAVCQKDENSNWKNEILWFPGEAICKKAPYQQFQKKQAQINKLVSKGKFRNIDIPYTANDLETRCI